ASDRKADELHLADPEKIEGGRDVVGELRHGVAAGNGIAAAVAAHVKPQHAVAGGEQRHQLLGPHAAVGCEGMREAHDLAVLWSFEGVVEPSSSKIEELFLSPYAAPRVPRG